MIKVKIYELDKHRNETTFRPYLVARNELRDVGIEITDGDSYDYAWIGQASVIDKKVSLSSSVTMGMDFLDKVTGDFMIFDGQDSHSLIGIVELLKVLNAENNNRFKLLLKNTLLSDIYNYEIPAPGGRWYWNGLSEDGLYSVPRVHDYMDKIKLSGTNWLHTIPFQFYKYDEKPIDVCALFGYPLTTGTEHGLMHYKLYNAHRKPCIDVLENMKGVKVAMLKDGKKLSRQQYYQAMFNSKIIVAPFGFGEIAPRDMEAASFGSVLIKPDMTHIRTYPNIYHSGITYVACKHDFSDLEDKIRNTLSQYNEVQHVTVNNMRAYYRNFYTHEKIALHMYNVLLNNLSDIST